MEILRNLVYLIAILILIYLILISILERESFVVKLVYKSVHQKNVDKEQIETLIQCLSMIIQNPNLIKWDVTGNTAVIQKLYYALLNTDIDVIKKEVSCIIKENIHSNN